MSSSKRSRSRSREASKSRSKSHRPSKRRRSGSKHDEHHNSGNDGNSSTALNQILGKINGISSAVENLNNRLTCLESDQNSHLPHGKMATDPTGEDELSAGKQDFDSCDQLSVMVPQDPEMASSSPEILDAQIGHKDGPTTSKALNLYTNNDKDNDNNGGKNLPETSSAVKSLPFDPVAEAPNWAPSANLKEFLGTNFRRSLSSSQIFSILEDTSLPEIDVFTTPKLDKALSDQIPQKYKKSVENRDKELLKVQRHVLNVAAPLTALHDLLENKQEMTNEDLLAIVEKALCLLGNASNSLSVLRRSKILYSINPSKVSLAEASFPNAGKCLFGNDISKLAADSADIARNLQKNLSQTHSHNNATPWPKTQFHKYQSKNEKFRPAQSGPSRFPHAGTTKGKFPFPQRQQSFRGKPNNNFR